MRTLRTYYLLAKPGIIYGNLMAAIAGFFLAAGASFDFPRLILMCVGLSLVIGCACTLNNCIDRDIDAVMARTKARALPQHAIPVPHALAFAAILGILGAIILAFGTSLLACILALAGLFLYLVPYTLLSKRTTPLSTPIGSISGAVPPLVGYAAAIGRLDLAAFCLFLILVIWQMPHFYAIAIFRREEYAAAGIPILPVVRGVRSAQRRMLAYVALLIAAIPSLYLLGAAGIAYLAVMEALSIAWLAISLVGFRSENGVRWAKRVFFFSLFYIMAFSIMIIIGALTR